MSRSRVKTNVLNSGFTDPDIFYKNRQYLKQIEAKGNGQFSLPKNYFYDFIIKYIEAYKNLSKSDIPIEIRRENVQKSREQISAIDKIHANNVLLNEMPILSILLHGTFMNSKDFRLNWNKDGTKQKSKWLDSTELKVDVIYISNPVLGDITYFMTSVEKEEYDKIILNLKYTSFLNKTLQKKQIDSVGQRLRDFHTNLFEERIKGYEKEKEDIEKKEKQVESYSKMEKKLLAAGAKIPADMEEFNNKRKEEIEISKKKFEPYEKSIPDYKRFIDNKRNKFQVYYFKKGFKINKLLVQDTLPFPQGIFDVDNNEFFFEYRIDEYTKKGDTFRSGNIVYVSMDKFINYYYDYCLDIKPKTIIVIDNSCGGFEDNHQLPNKETANKMRKKYTNTQSREKRSFNRSKLSLDKKHKSLSLNKTVKYFSFKRSNPLTNEEITNIQQSERQKQKEIKNELDIQAELNKVKVRSKSHESKKSHQKSHE